VASCATSPEPAKTPSEPTEQLPESAIWPKFTVEIHESLWGEKTGLEEVPIILGMTDVTLPTPSYLPENCEIKEVYLSEVRYREHGMIRLVISDEEVEHQGQDFECVLLMQINWAGIDGHTIPMKLPPNGDETGWGVWGFSAGEVRAVLDKRDDPVALWWQWPRDCGPFEIVLVASKAFPENELIKIVKSTLD
jgi:hypothetical protein